MKIFCPVILYVPSAFFTALVLSAPTSDPASDSVRHIVPPHSPESIFSTIDVLSFPSGIKLTYIFIAPILSMGYIENASPAAEK